MLRLQNPICRFLQMATFLWRQLGQRFRNPHPRKQAAWGFWGRQETKTLREPSANRGLGQGAPDFPKSLRYL